MEHMWSPWRMDYIRGEKPQGCFLCQALAHQDQDREALVLNRATTSFIIMNRYPYNNGHLMVVPQRHVAQLEELSPEERAELFEEATRCVSALRKLMQPEGFNVGFNLGEAAGAGLKEHLHLHVVPRWKGDTNFMTSLGGTRVVPQDLPELYDLLLPLLRY